MNPQKLIFHNVFPMLFIFQIVIEINLDGIYSDVILIRK